MDDKLINRNLRPKIQKKFYGHNKLYSKYEMKIPECEGICSGDDFWGDFNCDNPF